MTPQNQEQFDVFSMFATDPVKEVEGTWVPQPHGARLKIARHSNRRYNRLLGKLFDENKDVLSGESDEAEAKDTEVMAKVFAETILVDWEGVSYRGAPLPYTKANAEMLLKHRDFRLHVAKLSQVEANYRAELEAAKGEI